VEGSSVIAGSPIVCGLTGTVYRLTIFFQSAFSAVSSAIGTPFTPIVQRWEDF
jgi:hypothetical protein